MEASFLVRGLLIGLSVATAVGPMSILCMQRTVQRGFVYGLISGLGIATADGLYGCIAGFGLTIIATFLVNQQGWIRAVGGLFLLYLGCKTLLTKPAERAATDNPVIRRDLCRTGRWGRQEQRPERIARRMRSLSRLGKLVVSTDRGYQPVAQKIHAALARLDKQNFRCRHRLLWNSGTG
ncbi:MAG: hypothetical protein PVSMB5_38420 [Ktedonobacteraceae bacterium]